MSLLLLTKVREWHHVAATVRLHWIFGPILLSHFAVLLLLLLLALNLFLLLPTDLRKVRVWSIDDASRMENVKEDQCQEHWRGIKNVFVGLVCKHWIGCTGSLSVLSQAEDNTDLSIGSHVRRGGLFKFEQAKSLP